MTHPRLDQSHGQEGPMTSSNLRLQRAYDDPQPDDGYRVLVDRVWPRGKTRTDLRLDAWARDLGPSSGLRKWFGHDPARWAEFQRRYHAERCAQQGRIAALRYGSRRSEIEGGIESVVCISGALPQ